MDISSRLTAARTGTPFNGGNDLLTQRGSCELSSPGGAWPGVPGGGAAALGEVCARVRLCLGEAGRAGRPARCPVLSWPIPPRRQPCPPAVGRTHRPAPRRNGGIRCSPAVPASAGGYLQAWPARHSGPAAWHQKTVTAGSASVIRRRGRTEIARRGSLEARRPSGLGRVVSAGADGNARVGAGQRRGVVYAIAHHGDDVPAPLRPGNGSPAWWRSHWADGPCSGDRHRASPHRQIAAVSR